jgi:hypothetical protein
VPGALDVNVILGLEPLQITAAVAEVSAGVGFTVTTILYGFPGQEPTVDVGVTTYSTEPGVALPGLVSV